jgi:hypothetical protein
MVWQRGLAKLVFVVLLSDYLCSLHYGKLQQALPVHIRPGRAEGLIPTTSNSKAIQLLNRRLGEYVLIFPIGITCKVCSVSLLLDI